MWKVSGIVVLVVGLSILGVGIAYAEQPLAVLTGRQDWKAWNAGPAWRWKQAMVGGPGTGAWTYAEAGKADWRDYAVEATVLIDAPSDSKDPLVGDLGDLFAGTHPATSYRNNAHVLGYEAGLVLRKGSGGFYRLMFSVPYQEVLLWSSRGGILQVSPCALKQGKPHRLRAAAQGRHITLEVDGKSVIDYWDRVTPALTGGVAIGLHEGTAYWGQIRINSLPAPKEGPPPHQPAFTFRDWHGNRWAWDRGEPLFYLQNDGRGYEMKLVRGYQPQLYLSWAYRSPYAFTVHQQGETLRFELTSTDKDKTWPIYRTEVRVTYDAAKNAYVYDHNNAFIIPEGQVWRPGWLEFASVQTHGAVGSASTRGRQWATPHPWSVWRHESGALYKMPHNHQYFYPGFYRDNSYVDVKGRGRNLQTDGGFWAMVGDPIANPVFQMLGSSINGTELTGQLVPWCYRLSLQWMPLKAGGSLQPGTHEVRWRMTSADGREGDRWFAQAGWYGASNLDKKLLVYTGGVGHVESFDKVVLWASPFNEYPWGRAEYQDTTVGRGDRTSLRLVGPVAAGRCCGPSVFTEMMEPGTRYEVSAWVKTKDVTGEGPGIIFGGKQYFPGITGTGDWTKIGFVAEPDPPLHTVYFELRNSGGGTVWFDDFLIRPLKAGEKPAAPIAAAPKPLPIGNARQDRLLKWNGRSRMDDTGGTVLDLSGWGNHGRLVGTAAWVNDGKENVIRLDGWGGMISGGLFDFCGAKTISLWFKPLPLLHDALLASGGDRLGHEWQLLLHGRASTGVFRFGQHVDHRLTMLNVPACAANQWNHIAIVDDGTTVKLFVNGRKIEQEINREQIASSANPLDFKKYPEGAWCEVTPQATFPLMLGGRDSYIGGRARAFWRFINDGPVEYGFAGDIAACSYWGRSLNEIEVDELFKAGPFAP
ncbi:MAG: LamG-like jellyroll fold domain-containing protein [Armatimonadota bacterium]